MARCPGAKHRQRHVDPEEPQGPQEGRWDAAARGAAADRDARRRKPASIAVSSGPSGRRVPPPFLGALSFLGVYVAVSVFGAWTSGDVLASSILATRLLLTAAVILFLVRAYSALIVMRGLAIAMTTVGLCPAWPWALIVCPVDGSREACHR